MNFGDFDDDNEKEEPKHKSEKADNSSSIIPLKEGEIRIDIDIASIKMSKDNNEASQDEMEKASKSLTFYIINKEIKNIKGHSGDVEVKMNVKLFEEKNKIDITIPEYIEWNPNIFKRDTLNKIVDSLKTFNIEYAEHSFLTINLFQEKYKGSIISRELYKSCSIVCIKNNEKPKKYRMFFTTSSIEKNLKDVNPDLGIKEITNTPLYFTNIMIPVQLFAEEIKDINSKVPSKLIKVIGEGYKDICGNLHLQNCYISYIKITDKGYDKNNKA